MSGFVRRHRLREGGGEDAAAAVLRQAEEAGLETVRISFADQHGILRGKTLMIDGLKNALYNGVAVTSTLLLKDTSHRTVYPVWQEDIGFGPGCLTGAGDVLMIPDPTTFHILPWSPKTGWLLADLYLTGGQPAPVCSRAILRDALGRLHARGYEIIAGLEVEFHVLQLVGAKLALEDAGQPGTPPQTALLAQGYQYLTEQRYDELEAVFEVIRENCAGLGLPLASLEVEFGPSQLEATFNPAPGMAHADDMVLFRAMVKQVCRRHGWYATFMCRPRFDAAMASGWHLHQSLVDRDGGGNLFMPEGEAPISKLGG
ncbi:MAG: glutamine synthetase, partial [Alphaproteobacteria bacterium]